MTIKHYDDPCEMLEDIRKNEEAASSRVAPWQEKIKSGDHFVRIANVMGSPVAIFGKAIDSEYEEDRAAYREANMKHHRMTRCYSTLCPEGEFGDVHVVSVMSKITEEQFEEARTADWSMGILHEWADNGWLPDIEKEEWE